MKYSLKNRSMPACQPFRKDWFALFGSLQADCGARQEGNSAAGVSAAKPPAATRPPRETSASTGLLRFVGAAQFAENRQQDHRRDDRCDEAGAFTRLVSAIELSDKVGRQWPGNGYLCKTVR
ncbi:MAG: hypothetical protein LH632_20155 [Rhodoferax sp.]|nr:hypothetical protein [Rhodoferax sp.]